VKRWLFNKLVTNRVLGQFNGVRSLEILQRDPIRGSILPLNR
jgi:hypothetical protein